MTSHGLNVSAERLETLFWTSRFGLVSDWWHWRLGLVSRQSLQCLGLVSVSYVSFTTLWRTLATLSTSTLLPHARSKAKPPLKLSMTWALQSWWCIQTCPHELHMWLFSLTTECLWLKFPVVSIYDLPHVVNCLLRVVNDRRKWVSDCGAATPEPREV